MAVIIKNIQAYINMPIKAGLVKQCDKTTLTYRLSTN